MTCTTPEMSLSAELYWLEPGDDPPDSHTLTLRSAPTRTQKQCPKWPQNAKVVLKLPPDQHSRDSRQSGADAFSRKIRTKLDKDRFAFLKSNASAPLR